LLGIPETLHSATPRRPEQWIGLKCHAEGLTLSHDLEIHLGSNGYLGLAKIEYGKVNICGLFRKTIPAETKGPRLLSSRLRSPLLPPPDLRTVLAHVSQWLPIQEVASLRLFQHELREFGLLDDDNENQKLA